MTRTEVGEVLLTSVVTTVLVLVAFGALRLVFPEPAIRGSACPSSLGEPAYSECVRSWHVSHAERSMHRIATGLGVILVASAGLLLFDRYRLVPGVSVSLGLAVGTGFAGTWAAAATGTERVALLAAAGLFALASRLPAEQTRWQQQAAAIAFGAVACLTTWVVAFAFFYAAP